MGNSWISSLRSGNLLNDLGDDRKRKEAMQQVIDEMSKLYVAKEYETMDSTLDMFIVEYHINPDKNLKKGALFGCTAMIKGLCTYDGLNSRGCLALNKIIPLVLNACRHQDDDLTIPFSAFEALSEIIKASQKDIFPYFDQIFDELYTRTANQDENFRPAVLYINEALKVCVRFNIQHFRSRIGQLMSMIIFHLNTENPSQRSFLLSWIHSIWSALDLNFDIMEHLPRIFDGLLRFLSDSNSEVREKTVKLLGYFLEDAEKSSLKDPACIARVLVRKASSSDELTRVTVTAWASQLLKQAGHMLDPSYIDLLHAILSSKSDLIETQEKATRN